MKKIYMICAALALTCGLVMPSAQATPVIVKNAHGSKKERAEVKTRTLSSEAKVLDTKRNSIKLQASDFAGMPLKAPVAGDTFTFTAGDITYCNAVVTITPSNENEYYYYMAFTKQEVADIIDDASKAAGTEVDEATAINAYMAKKASYDLEMKNLFSGITGEPKVTFEEYNGTKGMCQPSFEVIPTTDYCLYATYMSHGEAESSVVTYFAPVKFEFKTKELTKSENVITINIADGKINITTTNSDTYGVFIFKTDKIADLKQDLGFTTDEELLAYAVSEYEDEVVYSGDQELVIAEEMPYYYDGDGNYTFMIAPYYKPSHQMWGDMQSKTFDYTAPVAKEYRYMFTEGQAAYWGDYYGDNYTLTLFKDWDDEGWLLAPYVEIDIYTNSKNSLAGNYNEDDWNITYDFSYAMVPGEGEDDLELDFKTGYMDVEFTGKTQDGMAEYKVSGEFIANNLAGDKFIIEESTIMVYAYDIYTEDQIILEHASGVVDVNAANEVISVKDGRINGATHIYDLQGREVTSRNGELNGIYIVTNGKTAQKVQVK